MTENNFYFGHEISWIFQFILHLLDLQAAVDFETQLSHIRTGVSILNYVITNRLQWEQIEKVFFCFFFCQFAQCVGSNENVGIAQEKRSVLMFQLMNVSEELSNRLSRASESTERSISCEIRTGAVTIVSLFWNGVEQKISRCGQDTENGSIDDLRRFPRASEKSRSFIELPLPIGRFRGAGLVIDHFDALNYLLPR